ncbi:MAG: PXA domain-containing protein [Linnemannia gamsii]|nr:MAG: PXA domain-containing protein [Linnemannia gamsii]
MFHYLRPARFTRPLAWSKVEKLRQKEQAAKYRVSIADTMPQFSEAVDQLIELIIRDYVAGWMRAITPEVVLQQRIEELLRIVLIRLKSRVMDLDFTQLLVTRLVPKVTAHVNDFRKAEMALRGNSLERSLTESDELDIMVAGKFRDGKLHRALSTSVSTKATEEAYLRNVVQTILPTLLPKNEVQSEILRHLLRELLVGAVLRPVMELLSDPDYWNQNVDIYVNMFILLRKMVKKLREALKQHTDSLDADSRSMENPADPYGPGADLYSFEDFLKMIKRCDSLLDVKRIRNTIMTQMRKKKALVVNREKDDIVNGNKRRTRDYTPEVKNGPSLINLETVLTNPAGLSYFMEFQDRRENMNELQFWLLIDTLNIKEDSIATFIDVTDTLREDVTMIYDTYFSESAPRPVDVDHSLIKVFRDFTLSDTSSLRSISDTEGKAKDEAKAAHVRRQLLVAQRQVFEQMSTKDYPEFVRSDLYFKFLTTYQNSLAEQNEEEESRSHIKPSGAQRTSTGPAILSAIGLTSPSNRGDTPENPKRSSTGSFLDIFGLGRDRDKERDGGQPTSAHRKSSSAMGHGRDNSLDLTDTEVLSRSITEDGNPALRDSLLMELQEQEDDDDDAVIEGGLAIPRMPKKKRTNGIDKLEAVLSSIVENQGGQTEGLAEGEKEKGSGPVPVDLTDPTFSTARDGQPGAAALMEWGKSEKASKKRFKEKTLETGKTVRVKSREPSGFGHASLSSMFEAEKAKPTTEAHSEESLSTSQQSISDTATVQDNVHLAAPGDLLLAARIKSLEQDIEMLRKQEAIVETLIQKAEQKERQDELRILKKSKSALRREILSMEYQKTQYEVQEEENMIMPGRSTINITSSTVGHDGSKEFALYVIEVHQLAQDGSFASGWVIARRYSEFFALHQQLKEKFASIVRQYELPGKRGFLKLQKSFVEGRRIGLERYLQSLVRHDEICQSQELRAFLSQENVALPQFSASTPALAEYNPFDSEQSGQDNSKSGGGSSKEGFMKHIYQTVSEGLDDMFSGGPPTVLGDITKKLGNQMMFSMEDEDEMTVGSTAGSVASLAGSIGSRKRHGSHGESGSQQQSRPAVVEAEGVTMFTEPLCDLFIELFELKEKNNWLRRQAVVIILQQVLGGTIERKLRDTIKAYFEESMLTFYVTKLRDSLWPPAPISPSNSASVRTAEQKATTKDQANRKLSAFLPELLGNMVGQQNARRGARRVFAAFQNRRLNQQLVYTTLDEVIAAIWPELDPNLSMAGTSTNAAAGGAAEASNGRGGGQGASSVSGGVGGSPSNATTSTSTTTAQSHSMNFSHSSLASSGAATSLGMSTGGDGGH